VPELPEVETIVRALRPRVQGRRLLGVDVLDPVLIPGLDGLSIPSRVRKTSRRGKYILLELEPGVLLVHLRMSGRLLWGKTPPEGRIRLVLRFAHGNVYLVDQRRLAQVKYLPRFEDGLGPEPLGDLSWLPQALARSRMPIKGWLLDQRKIAGIGNIYASEILFRAGIDPHRPANSLTPKEVGVLARAIPKVLTEAIAGKGTTLADSEYRQPTGELGGFQLRLSVYGRAGKPCPVCQTPIRRAKISGRSTYFCPSCQT